MVNCNESILGTAAGDVKYRALRGSVWCWAGGGNDRYQWRGHTLTG
jgi:hypothetical protein